MGEGRCISGMISENQEFRFTKKAYGKLLLDSVVSVPQFGSISFELYTRLRFHLAGDSDLLLLLVYSEEIQTANLTSNFILLKSW